jgi:hypothetical protein
VSGCLLLLLRQQTERAIYTCAYRRKDFKERKNERSRRDVQPFFTKVERTNYHSESRAILRSRNIIQAIASKDVFEITSGIL